jgi:Tfp pilus assembly protein PilF
VSRFTRLGGSDISRLIAHDVLLQDLLEENGLSNKDFSFRQKEKILDRLTVTADQLKQALSEKVNILRAGGAGLELVSSQEVRLPSNVVIPSGDAGIGDLTLSQPSLTYAELSLGLGAFLNPHGFEPEYSEYYLATSIYAPIRDVLRRVEWTPEHIDRILLVGGSGLLLPVQQSLQDYFPNAEIDTFADPADAQRCVGRGAAWHAFFLEAFGHSPIAPTIGESLSVATAQGPQVIIEENTPLPFPAEDAPERFYSFSGLTVPRTPGAGGMDLNITLTVGEQRVQSEVISLTAPTQQGDPIDLQLRFDENQVLEGRIVVGKGKTAREFPFRVDNPLSVSINPNAKREQILELERKMTNLSAQRQVPVVEKIARLRSELGEYDQARGLFEKLAQRATDPAEKAEHYERLADLLGKIGDDAGAEEYFRKAIELGSMAASFNFSLWLQKDGRFQDALEEIDRAIARGQGQVRHLLRSLILTNLKKTTEALSAYETGRDELVPLNSLSDWELAWLNNLASTHNDSATITGCKEALRTRKAADKMPSTETLLPDYQS